MNRPALYTRHTHLADAIARDWWLPGHDCEDVAQEARLALWIATGSYQPELGSFPHYARTAIKADLRDKLQAATRLKQRVLTDADRDQQLELFAAPNVEDIVLAREKLAELVARGPQILRRRQRDRARKMAA